MTDVDAGLMDLEVGTKTTVLILLIARYDFMGASQFELATSMGLRSSQIT